MFARGELWRVQIKKNICEKNLRKHLLQAPDHLVELRGKHLAVRRQRRERHTVLAPRTAPLPGAHALPDEQGPPAPTVHLLGRARGLL